MLLPVLQSAASVLSVKLQMQMTAMGPASNAHRAEFLMRSSPLVIFALMVPMHLLAVQAVAAVCQALCRMRHRIAAAARLAVPTSSPKQAMPTALFARLALRHQLTEAVASPALRPSLQPQVHLLAAGVWQGQFLHEIAPLAKCAQEANMLLPVLQSAASVLSVTFRM